MDVFLLREPTLSARLMYFVYTVLDLMAFSDQSVSDSLSTNLGGMLSSALGSDSLSSNLSTLVLAMWSLDHMEFEVSSDILCVQLNQKNTCSTVICYTVD